MKDSILLLLFQILAHLALIPFVLYAELYHYVISITVYFFTGCIGMTITYHRLLSHHSYKAPRWFEIFGTLCGTYGLTGSSIGWSAIHKEHHHYVDKEKDPHSPTYKGFFKTQYLSMFEKPNPKYAIKLIRDPFHQFLHKHYFTIHFVILILLSLIDTMLMISAYLVPAAILWNMGSFINSFTHMNYGYRNYETLDKSTNIPWLGYMMFGEVGIIIIIIIQIIQNLD